MYVDIVVNVAEAFNILKAKRIPHTYNPSLSSKQKQKPGAWSQGKEKK